MVWILAGAIATIGANALSLSPIARAVAQSFPGVAGPDVLIASAAYGLATAASAILIAPVVDRVGAPRTLRVALVAFAIALAGCALAPGLAALAAAQALGGIAAGAAMPAIYARAAEIAPPGREAQVMSSVLFGWTLSMVAGVSLAAIIADLAHWRILYAALSLLAMLFAVLLAGATRRDAAAAASASADAEPAAGPATGTSPESGLLGALAAPRAPALLAVIGLFMTGFYGAYSYLGPHLTGPLGFSTAGAGLATLAYGLGFGACSLLSGPLDRLGMRRTLPVALGAVLLVTGALALTSDMAAGLLAAMFFWGLVNHAVMNSAFNQLAAAAPAQRGRLLGLSTALTYLAVFLGALAFRPVYDAAGMAGCALTSLGLTLIAAVIALRDLSALQKRRQPS